MADIAFQRALAARPPAASVRAGRRQRSMRRSLVIAVLLVLVLAAFATTLV